ncbi:MAG: hypothetical protein JNM00_11155 [Flavobacteriales bacterium]|nr:hypothetical protein [Flavobacteriales bacterium]
MKKIQLSSQELAGMADYYRMEHALTVAKLRHIETILKKIGDAPVAVVKSSVKEGSPVIKGKPGRKPGIKASKPAGAKGKPGRKSHWTPWIMNMISNTKRPYTAQGIVDAAAKEFKINPSNRQKLVQNINAHIYRLRHTKQLISAKIPGKTFKYLAPPDWVGANNRIKSEFVGNIK